MDHQSGDTFMDGECNLFKLMILSTRPELPNGSHIDIDNGCIVVSPRITLKLPNGHPIEEFAWVRIQLLSPEVKLSTTSNRRVQLLFNDLIEDEHVAYLSPQLWYNLRYQHLRDSLEQVFWQYPLEQPDAQLMV